jgi:hypothetical protein
MHQPETPPPHGAALPDTIPTPMPGRTPGDPGDGPSPPPSDLLPLEEQDDEEMHNTFTEALVMVAGDDRFEVPPTPSLSHVPIYIPCAHNIYIHLHANELSRIEFPLNCWDRGEGCPASCDQSFPILMRLSCKWDHLPHVGDGKLIIIGLDNPMSTAAIHSPK